MIAGGWLAANLPVVLIIVLVIWFCVDYDGVWWNWGLADEASAFPEKRSRKKVPEAVFQEDAYTISTDSISGISSLTRASTPFLRV